MTKIRWSNGDLPLCIRFFSTQFRNAMDWRSMSQFHFQACKTRLTAKQWRSPTLGISHCCFKSGVSMRRCAFAILSFLGFLAGSSAVSTFAADAKTAAKALLEKGWDKTTAAKALADRPELDESPLKD